MRSRLEYVTEEERSPYGCSVYANGEHAGVRQEESLHGISKNGNLSR